MSGSNLASNRRTAGEARVLQGGGEMGALMRAIDWSKTAVGPVEDWPQSLRTALSILLETGFPMYIAWGPAFTQFYNDGYRPILGSTKHPAAMGISTRETFAEIWSIIGPMFEGVMAGKPVFVSDFHLPLDRHGFVEECYFVFSYSPIREEQGNVGGVLVTVTETTARVLDARRLVTLQDLAAKGQHVQTASAAAEIAAEVLGDNPADVPFALVYLLDATGGRAELAGAAGVAAGGAGSPTPIDVAVGDAVWPLGAVLATRQPELVELRPRTAASLAGPNVAPSRALVLPIFTPGGERAAGVLVAGLSPRLVFDAKYRGFLELVAGHVGSAIARVRALEEAKARAEALAEIDRAKTAFFSNVSHEFRTPITLMLGPAEDALATAEELSPAERERWAIVHRSALRLSKLVNTLLDFSRIEAGRIEASYEPTELSELTGELASMFRSAIERSGLELRLDLPPLREPAYVDREMWEKIVQNLLSNALKFTFEGEISVSLRLRETQFELLVRDSGIGIAEGELPRVFERFHRIKGVRSRSHEGTGIGLALVAELVKLHGGTVGVESAEGLGTTFTVRLPRGREHLPEERIGAARTLPPTRTGVAPFVVEALRWVSAENETTVARPGELPAASQGARRARIVLADDNADMRDYLSRLLGERWDVEACANGDAALRAIRRAPPDLVVSDVMMPGLDGFGLLSAIRRDADLRTTPVILLSARAGEESVTEGLDAGANDYIVKPFSARELLVRVASKIAVAEVAREARAVEEAARLRLYGHFMQAPFPISVLRGPDYEIELANSLMLDAWRKTEGIIGKPLLKGLPELVGQPFTGYLDEVRRTGVAYQEREALARLVRPPRSQPEDAYFDFVYAPLRGAEGEVDAILVAAFEVTNQVLASRRLAGLLAEVEANERELRELVENLPDLAWTARPDGHIDYYNQRWYEYTGTTLEEMQGWGWTKVHDPALLDAVLERWRRSIETGNPFEMEFPLRGADGVFRWFLTRVRPLRDADGRIVRWFGSNTNIDDRRRNEDFKETFVGILGHDLRNPLNTILTTSRVLAMRDSTPEEIKKRLERVTASGVRMQRMVDQLLDMTRARLAGGIPVTLTSDPIDLVPVVSKIVDELRAAHPSAAIDVSVEGECSARIDPDRFEQVVSNLLGNAITHGDATKPVRVDLAAASQAV